MRVMKTLYVFCLCLLFGAMVVDTPKMYAYRFVVYGDARAAKGDPIVTNYTILGSINRRIANLHPKPKFVLFLGDSVNRGWTANYTHNNLVDWKQFMTQTLRGIPLFLVIGNSEMYGNTGWTEYPLQTEYQRTFDYLPSNGPEHYKKLAYYFEFGKGLERTSFFILDSFGFYQNNGALTNFDNGYDAEQLAWFEKKAKRSDAHYKFALSHGPAFSIEGWPIAPSVHQMWNIMGKNHFDELFCAHEHAYSRWLINKKVYPSAKRSMIQTIVGSAGAPLDSPSLIKVDPHKAHVYIGYVFIVVDVQEHAIIQKTYALIPTAMGHTTRLIDKFKMKR